MTERFSCAQTARDRAEDRFGTASQIRRWILVEQPGPWGPDAALDSRLPTEVGRALRLHADRVGARLLLVRRHGRYDPVGRTCLVAVSEPGVRRVERLVVGDPAELLDVDWSPLEHGASVGGEGVSQPVFLVCTNGRHDPCCAERGRPLAHAMTAAVGEQAWESSHFGGDRFAGNLVCLPHGLYYGHVEAPDGPRLAALYTRGELDLEHYRGRSSEPFVVQAAEYFLRRRTGLVGLDDVDVESFGPAGEDLVEVCFRTPTGAETVTVRTQPGPPQQLTCRAGGALRPPRYREVVD